MIDTHVHLMPDRLARRIRSFFDEHISDNLAYPQLPDAVIESHIADGLAFG